MKWNFSNLEDWFNTFQAMFLEEENSSRWIEAGLAWWQGALLSISFFYIILNLLDIKIIFQWNDFCNL